MTPQPCALHSLQSPLSLGVQFAALGQTRLLRSGLNRLNERPKQPPVTQVCYQFASRSAVELIL